MRKLGCNSSPVLGCTPDESLALIKDAGFDSVFTSWDDDFDIAHYMNEARSHGLTVETLHCPFGRMNSLWTEDGNEGDHYTEKLRRCIQDAARYEVPYVIMHTTIGMEVPPTSHIGLMRYGKLVLEAEKRGVRLAFENLEYLRHLGLILDTFKSSPNVGFCYDIGHEHCYTPGFKMMPLFGDRLFCLHIHDNVGVLADKRRDYAGDMHRIPFDGNIDFPSVMKNIAASGFSGTLMLEIANREDYGFYNGLTAKEFYAKAYASAVRLRTLADGN